MASQGSSSRRSLSLTNTSLQDKKKPSDASNGGPDSARKSFTASHSMGLTGERTVKRLRLSKALTVPETVAAIFSFLEMQVPIHSLRHFESGCLDHPCQQSFRRVQSRVLIVSPTDTVLMTTKKMQEMRVSSAVVMIDNKPRGILTSKDILMRVISQNLPPKTTLVEKVMTPNPECATVDTPIVDALHTMHDGKFLHIPVLDRDGAVVAVVDVIHITHAAVATVGNTAGASNEAATNMMQTFWDSAMALSPNDDDDESRSEGSLKLASESAVTGRSLPFPPSNFPNTFAFKLQDKRGRMHRFTCNIQNLTELITSIIQRMGDDIDRNNLPQILYEDEDRDKVILASDSDLVAAVDHAKQVGWKGLRLHLDYSGTRSRRRRGSAAGNVDYAYADSAWASAYNAAAAGAALAVGLGVLAYLKRSGN